MVPWLAPTARSTDRETEWLLCAGCRPRSMNVLQELLKARVSFNYPSATSPQLAGSSARASSKRYAAQTRATTDVLVPCFTQLTVRLSCVLLVPAGCSCRPESSAGPASLHPGERLWSAGRLSAQEPHGFDVAARGEVRQGGHRHRRRPIEGLQAGSHGGAVRRNRCLSGSGGPLGDVVCASC